MIFRKGNIEGETDLRFADPIWIGQQTLAATEQYWAKLSLIDWQCTHPLLTHIFIHISNITHTYLNQTLICTYTHMVVDLTAMCINAIAHTHIPYMNTKRRSIEGSYL